MNPLALLPILKWVGIAIALVLAYVYVDHNWETSAGIKAGEERTTARYAIRDAAALKLTNDRIQQLQTEARAKERQSALEVVEIATKLTREQSDGRAKVASLNNQLRVGELRLFDRDARCPGSSDRGSVPGAGPSASGINGGAGVQLSEQTSNALIGLAGEADAVSDQLRACIQIIKADRK